MLPPAYFSRSSDFQVVFPIYARGDGRMWLGPVYRATGPQRDDRALLPLYGDFRSDGERTVWLGPWYHHEDDRERKRGVFPLYSTREIQQASAGRTKRSFSLLGGAYARQVTTDASGQRIAHRRRFLVLTESRSAGGSRTIGLLGLPIWERVGS